jgi:glycosyltransferase involved in cell wall biosynthesis
LIARLEWPRLARYEGWLCRQFDHVLAVTNQDRAVLCEWAGQPLDVTVLPIASSPQDCEVVQRRADARAILSVGSMFYPPNVDGPLWFAEAIYPRIKARLPDAQLHLVGGRPAPEIRRLGRDDPSIEVAGYVPDLEPYLERSAVLIAPLRYGSGMRVKILDALTRGMPVVSTSLGCEGIAVTSGKDILIADQADDFAAKVVQVIEDRELADRLARDGRRLIESEYDWRDVYQKLDDVYAHLLTDSGK